MQVNTQSFITKTLALDEAKLPDLPDVTTKIFAQHAPNAGKEACSLKSSVTVLKGSQQALLDAPENIRKAERSEKLHKILSIALLAVAVAFIATAVILGLLVNPLCFIIAAGTLITCIAAGCLNHPFYQTDGGFPIISEVTYIHSAFTYAKCKLPTIAERQKNVEETQQAVNINLHRLLTVQEQKSRIKEGIKRELMSIDLSDPQADMVRVNDLRAALARLEQVNALFELLK